MTFSGFGLQNYSHAAAYSPARFGSISNSPGGCSKDPRCTMCYIRNMQGLRHRLPIHPQSPLLLVRGMEVYQDRNQTCKQSSLMALTYLQLSPAVHFVRHLGLSPLRDIEMQGRGAAATDVPLQKELWSIFFSTGAIIQFLNHHFA